MNTAGRDPLHPHVVRVVIGGDCAAALCDEVESLLRDGSTAVITCDVHSMVGTAAEVLDLLARVQLTALRCGGEIRLSRADPALLALLDLLGLADVLKPVDEP
jgi:hypothetical protein